MYITGKYLLGSLGDLSDVIAIRDKVFIDEQGVAPELEHDGKDNEAIFALAFEEGNDFKKPVATGRLLFLGDEFKIGRIATLKEYRGKGYGDFVVRMLIDKAFTMGAKEIFVDAQVQAVGFYKTIGFREVGDVFEEAGMQHQRMVVEPHTCTRQCSCH
ncbi:MAG: GNAT family N-acetyltransferase [Lachnospiraceae bacterium]|nr:GNAT family N-acetyltransferase [Lachnospiraceae bacterium]